MPLYTVERTEISTMTMRLTILADNASIASAIARIGSLERVTQKESVIDHTFEYSDNCSVSTPVEIDLNSLSL